MTVMFIRSLLYLTFTFSTDVFQYSIKGCSYIQRTAVRILKSYFDHLISILYSNDFTATNTLLGIKSTHITFGL